MRTPAVAEIIGMDSLPTAISALLTLNLFPANRFGAADSPDGSTGRFQNSVCLPISGSSGRPGRYQNRLLPNNAFCNCDSGLSISCAAGSMRMLPLQRHIIRSYGDQRRANNPEPVDF